MPNNNQKRLNEAIELLKTEAKDIFVGELEDAVDKALDKAKGQEKAFVESASNLNDEEKNQVEQILVNIFKRHLKIAYTTKPLLLAGFKISVGDWKLDGSLLHQIDQIGKNIVT